jgi:alpha-tubulin suppressor-like RCC1 family protein
MYVWGRNNLGQLGDGTNTQRSVPTAINCPATSLANNDYLSTSNELKVYPNPVNNLLNISFDQTMNSVALYNLLGQEVITKLVNANETSIDVSALPSGTYLIKVNTEDKVKSLKVVKQ